MTARVDMLCIDADDDWDEILSLAEHSPYSRIPVYEGSADNIIGVLVLNHFLKTLTEEDRPELRSLLMKPCFIYKTTTLPPVLKEPKTAKQHLAVVAQQTQIARERAAPWVSSRWKTFLNSSSERSGTRPIP